MNYITNHIEIKSIKALILFLIRWKYILNICLLVKDGLTIIWLIKEESLDNYQSWTFSGFGYFLGRTFCSIPFFITISILYKKKFITLFI